MKIIGWTSFDSFCQGICVEQRETMIEALNETLRVIQDNGYVFSGETHQMGLCTVPVFDNGKCLRCSMRAWATLMSIAHTGDSESYMEYYMDRFIDEEHLPEDEASTDDFVVDDEVEGVPYYYVNQDLQLAAESASAGIELMSFDTVVLALFDLIKEHMN